MAARSADSKGGPMRALTVAGVVISVIAGALGLLFTLEPDLKPCLGDTEAEFTGAPVFPRVGFRDHLVRGGMSFEEAKEETNVIGAEIRFSFRTSGLRGERLPLTYSLLEIGKDGTLGAVVPGVDRNLAMTVRPQHCSQTRGMDLFIAIPRRGRNYRVVLELYRDDDRLERLALLQSETFRG